MNTNSSTVSGERARQSNQSHEAVIHKTLQQRIGTIVEVHQTLPMVKIEYAQGSLAGGGRFIPVGHSVLDILQRFGTLRNGLRVMVTFSGDQENTATCQVIGVEDERLGSEIQQLEEMQTPLYEIFTPGSM